MKVVSPTNRPPLSPGYTYIHIYIYIYIYGAHFRCSLSRSQGHGAARRIMSMKNSSGNIENKTRDLPARSVEPQPTAPQRAPLLITRFKHPRKDSETYSVATSCNTRCRGHDTVQVCRTTAWASSSDYQRPLQAATCTTTLNLAFVRHCAPCRSVL
jgi:hypothetical protein